MRPFMFKRDLMGWFGTAVPFKWISVLFSSKFDLISYEMRMLKFLKGKLAVLSKISFFLSTLSFFAVIQ